MATNETEAVTHTEEIGYPVVLKLFSETIMHKTDVGSLQLDLDGADAVHRAYRTIEAAVGEKAGAEHFLGVTVQPMVALDGYELILGSRGFGLFSGTIQSTHRASSYGDAMLGLYTGRNMLLFPPVYHDTRGPAACTSASMESGSSPLTGEKNRSFDEARKGESWASRDRENANITGIARSEGELAQCSSTEIS